MGHLYNTLLTNQGKYIRHDHYETFKCPIDSFNRTNKKSLFLTYTGILLAEGSGLRPEKFSSPVAKVMPAILSSGLS